MHCIEYIDRNTGKKEVEKVYGETAIRLLYGTSFFQRTVGRLILHLFGKWPFISRFYGYLQTLSCSRKKIAPFIKEFALDISEFEKEPESFTSFNDFFIRHLKPEARPMPQDKAAAIIPADGRYLVYQHLEASDLFSVKGKQYTVREFLNDPEADRYIGGSLCMARLCPIDCHRFFFPIDGTPGKSRLIEGKLFSVNPIAVQGNPWIFFENRRVVTYIESETYGKVAFVEIGATAVGSIHQTYTPFHSYRKGDEKGYFSFGGSALALFFEPGKIQFEQDLLQATEKKFEMRCLIGQILGKAKS